MPYLTCLAASNKGKKENKEKVFYLSHHHHCHHPNSCSQKQRRRMEETGNRGGRGYLPGMLFLSSLKVAEAAWLWRVHPGGGFGGGGGLAVALVV
jgi:hypothetical protein